MGAGGLSDHRCVFILIIIICCMPLGHKLATADTEIEKSDEAASAKPAHDQTNNQGAHSTHPHSAIKEESVVNQQSDAAKTDPELIHHTDSDTNVGEKFEHEKYGESEQLELKGQAETINDDEESHAGSSEKKEFTSGESEKNDALKAQSNTVDKSVLSSNAQQHVKRSLKLAPNEFSANGLNKMFAIIEDELKTFQERIDTMSHDEHDATLKSLENKVASLSDIQQSLSSLRTELTEMTNRQNYETKSQNTKYEELKTISHQISSLQNSLETNLTDAISSSQRKQSRLETRVKAQADDFVGFLKTLDEQLSSKISNLQKTMDDQKDEMTKKTEDIQNQLYSDVRQVEDSLNEKIDELRDSFNNSLLEVQSSGEESVNDLKKEFKSANEVLKTDMQSMDRSITRLTDQQNMDRLETNAEVRKLENALTNMINTMSGELKHDLSLKAEQLTASIDDAEARHKELKEDYKRQVITSGAEMKTLEEGLLENISNLKNHLTESMEIIGKTHNEWKDEVAERLSFLKQTISDLDLSLKEKEKLFRELEKEADKRFSDIMKEVDSKIASSESELQKLEGRRKEMEELIEKQQELLKLIHANTFNKEAVVWAALVLTFLVVANMVITYAIIRYNSDKLSGGSKPGTDTSRFTLSGNSKKILDLVPSNPPLQPSVCVVSYGRDRQLFNTNVINSVVSVLSGSTKSRLQVLHHLIDNHTNIPELPHCKLIIMCVEFSERHVIIEEQGIGLGDIRLTTYSAIQKMGANLVILYTKDPESRQLSPGKFYNQEIYCVKSQEQLIKLNEAGRFFSLYDQLTDFQKQRLSRTITECCKP